MSAMMDLPEALQTHFREREKGVDNLPIAVAPWNRNQGRPGLSLVMGDLGFTTGIEIGVGLGRSAKSWCNAMPDLHLICIDPYLAYSSINNQERQDRAYEKAKAILSGYNVELVCKPSGDVAAMFDDESVDFVYIDGDHTFDAVIVDIVKYVPKVRMGGLVLVHDYFHFRTGGVVAAVDGYTRCHGIDPWYVTFDVAPTVFWQRGSERL